MKLNIKFFLAFLIFVVDNAHFSKAEDIKYPYVNSQSAWNCIITKVERNENNTKVYIYYRTPYLGGWINISPLTFLVDSQKKVHRLLNVEGIPLSPGKHVFNTLGEGVAFTLVFPAISKSVSYFRIDEDVPDGFHFYDIKFHTDYEAYQRRYRRMKSQFEIMYRNKSNEESKREQTDGKMSRNRNLSNKKTKTLKKNPNFKIE